MRIVSVSMPNVSFGRNLTQEEMKEYKKTLSEGKKLTGQTGKSIFIMPSSCLPQTSTFNSGVGTLSSDISQRYLKYMHDYTGFNMLEDLPSGQVEPLVDKFYCAYHSSALALGNQQINPELLTTKEFERILTKKDLKEISKGNESTLKDEIVNFKNVVDVDGKHNKVLKKAFERFNSLDSSNQLKQRFSRYVEENSMWLNFKRAKEDNQEFFKFKQFLADEHLKIAKEKLSAQGIKLCGDCLIYFSPDEVNAFPNAFKKDHFVGLPNWGAPSLNYDEITNEFSDAAKLLKQKIQLMARRYDAIRFDVGWAYVCPVITPKGEKYVKDENKKYLGDSLIKLIEKWVKEVKGQDFDINNLMYEFDAGGDVFSMFGPDGKQIQPLEGKVKILGNTYMKKYPYDEWGYNEAYLNRGWSKDEYVLGVGNHDPQPLRQIAKNIPEEVRNRDFTYRLEYHKSDAIPALSYSLKIPEKDLQNPSEFAKAKWADPMMAKNNQMFYMDVFGREERFDMQGLNLTRHPEKNYAYKVSKDYDKAYMKGLSEGFGFNPMAALKRVFIAKGFDKSHPELFANIEKFDRILLEPEPIINLTKKHNKLIKNGVLILGLGAIVTGVISILNKLITSKDVANITQYNSSHTLMDKFVKK